MTRAEKVAEARRLRGEGLLLREVAERMGVKFQTVHGWLADPDLSMQRARRRRYAGSCVDCGAATDGSGGYEKAAERCALCRARYQRETRPWPREAIVLAIQAFADLYGRQPKVSDWNSGPSSSSAEQRERYYRDGCWPSMTTVQNAFGSWNAALRSAGFEPQREFSTPFRDAATRERMLRKFADGERVAVLAARYGVSGGAIYRLARKAGIGRRGGARRAAVGA